MSKINKKINPYHIKFQENYHSQVKEWENLILVKMQSKLF
jgi:hypothetical protein